MRPIPLGSRPFAWYRRKLYLYYQALVMRIIHHFFFTFIIFTRVYFSSLLLWEFAYDEIYKFTTPKRGFVGKLVILTLKWLRAKEKVRWVPTSACKTLFFFFTFTGSEIHHCTNHLILLLKPIFLQNLVSVLAPGIAQCSCAHINDGRG